MSGANSDTLIEVSDLSIGFGGADQPVVEGVSFHIRKGEVVSIVGESGSGKTLSCRAMLRILPPRARILSGQVVYYGGAEPVDLLSLPEPALRALSGDRLAMIFQEPMSAFSPLHTIGDQVSEALRLHRDMGSSERRRRTLDAFERVGFPDPERAWRSYPFELSGGLRQRAMIAMAMVVEPDLLIADEPTTALDVTTQAQVLALIKRLQREAGMSVALITHDLGVVANMADRVVVMRKGRVVERGAVEEIISRPLHGYTRRLVEAAPEIPACPAEPERIETGNSLTQQVDPSLILSVANVSKTYMERSRGWIAPKEIPALRDIDLQVRRGATTAIVGESGSGKSTLARIALAAEPPDPGGHIYFREKAEDEPCDLATQTPSQRKAFRRSAQMVMQDPFAALSPRMRICDILTEPLEVHRIGNRAKRLERAAELMGQVGLDPSMLDRYPHAFSGGQRQRISIARSLALEPSLMVLDEPTSALDVSVQADVLALLKRLRAEQGLTYLFISHDLAVVAALADRVAVMRAGRIVEEGPAETVLYRPAHPYTRALIAASPEPDMNRPIDMSAVALGAGKPDEWPEPFGYRGDNAPPLIEIAPDHRVRKAA